MKLRARINAMCKSCTYDPLELDEKVRGLVVPRLNYPVEPQNGVLLGSETILIGGDNEK